VFDAGVIIVYRLYHNGILIYNSSTACNITLTNLQTWSAHELRVETCTAVGCSSSNSVLSRTQELPPQGLVGLVVNVTSPHSVLVYWTPVRAANGLLRYDVYFTGPFYTQQSASRSVLCKSLVYDSVVVDLLPVFALLTYDDRLWTALQPSG